MPSPLSDFSFPANITIIEELIVSPALPCLNVFTVTGGASAFSGHGLALMQDLFTMVNYLPRLPSEIDTDIFVKRGVTAAKFLHVRRGVVQQIIKVLEAINPAYHQLMEDPR